MGTLYIQPTELSTFGLSPFAIQQVSDADKLTACQTASSTADTYFRGRYPLPFTSFDVDIKMRVAHIAIWLLLSSRGRNPEAGYDDQIDERYNQAIEWLEHVQRGAAHPNVTFTAPSPPRYSMPAVISSRPRGWGGRGR